MTQTPSPAVTAVVAVAVAAAWLAPTIVAVIRRRRTVYKVWATVLMNVSPVMVVLKTAAIHETAAAVLAPFVFITTWVIALVWACSTQHVVYVTEQVPAPQPQPTYVPHDPWQVIGQNRTGGN